jgi:hypothetical protein
MADDGDSLDRQLKIEKLRGQFLLATAKQRLHEQELELYRRQSDEQVNQAIYGCLAWTCLNVWLTCVVAVLEIFVVIPVGNYFDECYAEGKSHLYAFFSVVGSLPFAYALAWTLTRRLLKKLFSGPTGQS